MDCIICGNWFSSAIHNGACPTCERAIKQLRLNMTPDRIKKLSKAEKDGRMVVLPCKVGDTVWTNTAIVCDRYRLSNSPYPVEVVFIGIVGNGCFCYAQYSNGRVFPFYFDKVDKTVFLTREEAEVALKKREEEDNETD